MLGDSIIMGIKLWPAPQISEHCPIRIVGRLIINEIWFNRPGVASAFTPKEGIVHEWITSFDVINIRVGVIGGTIILLDVFNRRVLLDGENIELNFMLDKFGYSYDQYHW